MSRRKAPSVEGFKLEGSFGRLRNELSQEKYASLLDKPLAYWALPTDRRLPLAFMGWTLRDLLSTPFEQLMATPGIGFKKITALLELLTRASQTDLQASVDRPTTEAEQADTADLQAVESETGVFDADRVSEAHWSRWCETIERHQLGHLVLGRVAPTLQALPTVIWDTPLSYYEGRTLAEIRSMKTHGEKRVRVILEVFSIVHHALDGALPASCVDVQLAPKFVRPLERWFADVLSGVQMPSADELRTSLIEPLVEQVGTDLGETVEQLAAERLGLNGAQQSVRAQAKRMQVTRARVYQLLDECARAMRVRWPEGEWLLAALERRLAGLEDHDQRVRLFYRLADLFYPRSNEDVAALASETAHPQELGSAVSPVLAE